MTHTSWLLLRDELSGTGADGTSPDIILGGTAPDPAYATDYGKAFGATGKFGGTNYVYVRAVNKDAAQAIGSVSVYAAQIGNLPHRNLWTQLQTADARVGTNISAGGGAVGVTGAPLVWEAGDTPPAAAPWCLIAQITGDGHPAPTMPSTVKDKASFDAWIAKQPGIAYTIVEAPAVVPAEPHGFGWSRRVDVGNAEPTTLTISVGCIKAPADGTIAFRLDKPGANGRPIGLDKMRYLINGEFGMSAVVPAGFSSTLSIAFAPPDETDVEAEFVVRVSTETGGDWVDEDGEITTPTPTPVARHVLSFGQTNGAS